MAVFDAGDIVQFAIRIEENGMNFYRYAIQVVKDAQTKQLLSQLADEEAGHKRFFEKLLAGMERNVPAEGYEGEYDAYLRDYVDNKLIFTDAMLEKHLREIKDTRAVIDFALEREMASIFYYNEVKRLVSPAQHGAIDTIIDEERRHVAKLSAIRQGYA